jgi:hypothetical protein
LGAIYLAIVQNDCAFTYNVEILFFLADGKKLERDEQAERLKH